MIRSQAQTQIVSSEKLRKTAGSLIAGLIVLVVGVVLLPAFLLGLVIGALRLSFRFGHNLGYGKLFRALGGE